MYNNKLLNFAQWIPMRRFYILRFKETCFLITNIKEKHKKPSLLRVFSYQNHISTCS